MYYEINKGVFISPLTEKPLNQRETFSGPSVHPVVLPQNLHMQSLSIPGWNYNPEQSSGQPLYTVNTANTDNELM